MDGKNIVVQLFHGILTVSYILYVTAVKKVNLKTKTFSKGDKIKQIVLKSVIFYVCSVHRDEVCEQNSFEDFLM